MFRSSLNYEASRVEYRLGSQNVKKLLPNDSDLKLSSFVSESPNQVELYIRVFLSFSKSESYKNSENLSDAYFNLLKIRPSWPYYYSGLAQIKKIEQNDFNPSINKAIMLAPFERKVVESVSQLLFSNWESIDSVMKKKMLVYLSSQSRVVIERLISTSLRFARLFEFCDYLYESKRIEYQTCKLEFWQPLMDST
jgi:hypothetical protein